MNKHEFIEELEKQTGYDKEKCILINDALEEHFIIGKKNKEKTIASIRNHLNCEEEEANHIYEISSSIMTKAIKNKILHPFR